ncbi:MAG: peptide chain release factor 2 [Candidatus Omnitrophica bacterium]|nr:peptide chain release factor 2 [Candidatus Omnitrophota bacterium]
MLDDIKAKLAALETRLQALRGYLDVDNKKKLIEELSLNMSGEGFWDNSESSTRTVRQLKQVKSVVEPWDAAFRKLEELKDLSAITADEDKDLIFQIGRDLDRLIKDIDALEFKTLLGQKFDASSAILSINAGAGGTESCDWVNMLLRMYTRFAEKHGYDTKTLDILFGEEAGVKNVTILITGDYAYGYLKAERGVHRLVRISPFDANKRRHTSFASVDVIPEIEEDADIKLEEKDLRIDVYRSKGAGGQSVNTTDSAVRITHIPTGLVAQCQNERSQHQNKQMALKILKARLFEEQQDQKEKELLKQYGTDKQKIEFGSQIRSYVMHPYNMVKDHRTEMETGDVDKIMDGSLDEFIEAYLKMTVKKG